MRASSNVEAIMYTPAPRGGHARYSQELLTALAEVGGHHNVRVSLVTRQDLEPQFRKGLYPIYDILPPAPITQTKESRLLRQTRFLRYLISSGRAFREWVVLNSHIDVIHFQEYDFLQARGHFQWLRSRGKRLFFTVHNIYPHQYPIGFPKALVDAMNRDAWRMCHGLFVHSEGLKSTLESFLGPQHPPIFVVPHGLWGVPPDIIWPSPVQRQQSKTLLFFGAIRPNKGLHVLLQAMKTLSGYRLIVVGECRDRRYRREIVELIDELPRDQIEYVDRFVTEQEMHSFFCRSAAAILPYSVSFVAQSGVLHDALAHGLPVVVSEVGALGDSVRAWGVGEIVPPDDPVALGYGIQRLFEGNRFSQAYRAINEAVSGLSWTHTAEATINGYQSVWRP